ncbi:MAG: SusF/SusE family outer membrane protein, partial [Muribaculaceae bacterium]
MKKFTLTVMSAVLGLLSMSAVDADQLYVVGSATAAGWSPDKALEMTKVSDNVFSWTGELKGGEFKFLTTVTAGPPASPGARMEAQARESAIQFLR